jgi:hypothetical protein
MKQTLLVIAACLFLFSICYADYAVQVGAFEDPANVDAAVERLKAAGFNPVIDPYTTKDRVQLKVVMAGPYLSKKEADKAMIALRRLGIKGFVRQYWPKKQLPIEIKSQKFNLRCRKLNQNQKKKSRSLLQHFQNLNRQNHQNLSLNLGNLHRNCLCQEFLKKNQRLSSLKSWKGDYAFTAFFKTKEPTQFPIRIMDRNLKRD